MQAQKGLMQESHVKSPIGKDRAVTGLQARATHCPLGLSMCFRSRRKC